MLKALKKLNSPYHVSKNDKIFKNVEKNHR